MTEQFARWLSDRYSLDEGKIAVVPNAVCANQFCPPSPSERLALRAAHGLSADQEIVCFIGRLNPEKRVGYLIRFLARHGPDFPQLMLLVGGDGPDGTALRAEAAALNVQSHVRFLGHLRDPRAVYAMSDLCVLPSAEEMFPLVVVEAALTGVPTLRGDSWGHELRQTGESFTSGDEASFQRKLCEMLSSREQLRELGAQARAHSLANLTENATYPRMESLYRRLVKLHRS
jgi:D-inositol-3-phosphate glycosyltransferase